MELKAAGLGKRLTAALVDVLICSAVSAAVLFGAIRLFLAIWHDELMRLMRTEVFAESDPVAILSASPGMALWFVLTIMVTVLITLLATHLYFMFYENKTGATPGKKMMGIKVVSLDGTPITMKQAMWRELGRWYVDFSFVLPALIAMAMTEKRQRIGDLLARTWVIENPARNTQG